MSSSRSIKNIRITEIQQQAMLDFMNEHPEFAAGRFTGPMGRIVKQDMWERLAALLNANGIGVVKGADKWSKSWDDWKSKTKQKASMLKIHAGVTGGGKPLDSLGKVTKLNDLELRLMEFIGLHCAFGDGTQEAGFSQVNDMVELLLPVVQDNAVTQHPIPVPNTATNQSSLMFELASLFSTPNCSSMPLAQTSFGPSSSASAAVPVPINEQEMENKSQGGVGKNNTPKNVARKYGKGEDQYGRGAASFLDAEAEKLKVLNNIATSMSEIAQSSKIQARASMIQARAIQKLSKSMQPK